MKQTYLKFFLKNFDRALISGNAPDSKCQIRPKNERLETATATFLLPFSPPGWFLRTLVNTSFKYQQRINLMMIPKWQHYPMMVIRLNGKLPLPRSTFKCTRSITRKKRNSTLKNSVEQTIFSCELLDAGQESGVVDGAFSFEQGEIITTPIVDDYKFGCYALTMREIVNDGLHSPSNKEN